MKVQPLYDNVLIKKDERPEKVGSFFMPEQSRGPSHKVQTGEVVAIGLGRLLKDGSVLPIDEIQVGERVFVDKWTGNPVRIGDDEYWVININNIAGKVEED